jgi:3-oxoadipate enol-lactonase
MEGVWSDGVRLAVEVVGHGEPVTLLGHGLTSTRHEVAIFAPFLPGTKVLFDFRGHGDSDRPGPGSYSMDHFASDVDAVAGAFDTTCAGGVSLGSGAILRLLCSRPDRFERLVFLMPARIEEGSHARWRLLHLADLLATEPLGEVADRILAEEGEMGAYDAFPASRDLRRLAILGMNADGTPHAIRECVDDPPVRDPEPLTRVTAPALVIGQEGDPVHTAAVAREVAGMLPNAELLLFPDPFALIRDIPTVVQRTSAFLAGAG